MNDPRLNLTQELHERLKALLELRRSRGLNCTLTAIGQEILADWLPSYINREEAIAKGAGPCLPQSPPEPPPSPSRVTSSPAPATSPSPSTTRAMFAKFVGS